MHIGELGNMLWALGGHREQLLLDLFVFLLFEISVFFVLGYEESLEKAKLRKGGGKLTSESSLLSRSRAVLTNSYRCSASSLCDLGCDLCFRLSIFFFFWLIEKINKMKMKRKLAAVQIVFQLGVLSLEFIETLLQQRNVR